MTHALLTVIFFTLLVLSGVMAIVLLLWVVANACEAYRRWRTKADVITYQGYDPDTGEPREMTAMVKGGR